MGGGGTATPETAQIARKGVRNLLIHAGILQGQPVTAPSRMLSQDDDRCFHVTNHGGLVDFNVTLGDTVAVAAMGRGDLVGHLQRLADAHGDGFLAGIHMGQPRHLGREVKLVRIVLEGADAHHLAVHAQVVFGVGFLGHNVPLRRAGQ